MDLDIAVVGGGVSGAYSAWQPTLVEVVVPHDLPPQLKRLAEPPTTLRRRLRKESPISVV